MDNPPEFEDGYFMPPKLLDLLEFAVNKTIPKLRFLQLNETAEKGYLQTSSPGWAIKFSVRYLNKRSTNSLQL